MKIAPPMWSKSCATSMEDYDFSDRKNPLSFCSTCRLLAPSRPGGCCVCVGEAPKASPRAAPLLVDRAEDWRPGEEETHRASIVRPKAERAEPRPPNHALSPAFVDEVEVERRARLKVGPAPKNPQRGHRWRTALERLKVSERAKMARDDTVRGPRARDESATQARARFLAIAEAVCDVGLDGDRVLVNLGAS